MRGKYKDSNTYKVFKIPGASKKIFITKQYCQLLISKVLTTAHKSEARQFEENCIEIGCGKFKNK